MVGLLTPEGRNILRGISRAYVMELASDLGLESRECNIEPLDIYEADEAFHGNPFCILPTTHLNGVRSDRPNKPITQRLLDQWSLNVGVDIVQQIRKYGEEVENCIKRTPYLTSFAINNESDLKEKIFLLPELPRELDGL